MLKHIDIVSTCSILSMLSAETDFPYCCCFRPFWDEEGILGMGLPPDVEVDAETVKNTF